MEMVRCACNKALGERQGSRLIIRRLGLVLVGGVHTWTCERCGARATIDLEPPALEATPIVDAVAIFTAATEATLALERQILAPLTRPRS